MADPPHLSGADTTPKPGPSGPSPGVPPRPGKDPRPDGGKPSPVDEPGESGDPWPR